MVALMRLAAEPLKQVLHHAFGVIQQFERVGSSPPPLQTIPAPMPSNSEVLPSLVVVFLKNGRDVRKRTSAALRSGTAIPLLFFRKIKAIFVKFRQIATVEHC